MTKKDWMLVLVLLALILLPLVLLAANPEAVGRWRARACVAEEMFYSRYLYDAAGAGENAPEPVKTYLDPEKMARHTAYNVCSQLTQERLKSPSWIEEKR
jgi:hypothetical protein